MKKFLESDMFEEEFDKPEFEESFDDYDDEATDDEIWARYIAENDVEREEFDGFDYEDEPDYEHAFESKGAYHRGRKYSNPSFDDKERAMACGPAAEYNGPKEVKTEPAGFKVRRANNLKYDGKSTYKPVRSSSIDESIENRIWDKFIENKLNK